MEFKASVQCVAFLVKDSGVLKLDPTVIGELLHKFLIKVVNNAPDDIKV